MKHARMLPTSRSVGRHAALMRGITTLPLRQREVLALFYFETLTLEEIAAVLETSEDEIAALFYLAHESLGMAPALGEIFEEASIE